MLRHVVLLQFKQEITPDQMQLLKNGFLALKDQIDSVQNFEWGMNISPENLSKGFTHCFIVTFADEAARDAYLVHEAHQAFAHQLLAATNQILVVDFWAQS